jgi:hypothetical protein
MEPGVLAIMMVFGIPMLAIYTSHRREMMKMKLQMRNQADPSVVNAVEQLRAEVRSLRDTTTQYDVSFDSALQRLERRVDTLEIHAITARSESSVRNVEIQAGR